MDNSQQVKCGRVAPLNPDPRWAAGYFEVLEALGVEERPRRFYAHWVRQFFKRRQGPLPVRDLQLCLAEHNVRSIATIGCALATGFVLGRS